MQIQFIKILMVIPLFGVLLGSLIGNRFMTIYKYNRGIMSILPRSRIYGIKTKKHGILVLFIVFLIMKWLIASCRYRLFSNMELIFSVGDYILQENVLQNLLTKRASKTCNNRDLHYLDRYRKKSNSCSSRFGKIRP